MNETKKTFKDTYHSWLNALNGPLAFVVVVFTIAGVYFFNIDSRVRSIVKDPEFVAAVAQRVRPAMVFDSKGIVLADMGALAFLEEVPRIEDISHGVKITIHPKAILPAEPIIQALDEGNVSVKAQRSSGLSWEIVVSARHAFWANEYSPPDPTPERYRLEIVVP